jgi:hypothetical protein
MGQPRELLVTGLIFEIETVTFESFRDKVTYAELKVDIPPRLNTDSPINNGGFWDEGKPVTLHEFALVEEIFPSVFGE